MYHIDISRGVKRSLAGFEIFLPQIIMYKVHTAFTILYPAIISHQPCLNTLIFTHLDPSYRANYPTQQVKLPLLITVRAKVSMWVCM